MSMLESLSAVAPIWVVAFAAFAVLLLTVAGGHERRAPGGAAHLAVVSLGGLVLAALLLVAQEGVALTQVFSGAILVDGLGVVFGFTALVAGVLAIPLAKAYLHEHGMSHGEFFALVLLCVVGMLVVSMAGDLMTFFIGLETMSLAAYVLAGYRRSSRKAQEAALKYFFYGAFASGFLLFGIALLYGEVGKSSGAPSLRYAALAQLFSGGAQVGPLGWLAVSFLLAGLSFKIAAVPFHMWAPDVYEGAPTPSTGFMAVGIKAAAFAGLCRFLHATLIAAVPTETMIQGFEVLAVITMVVGNTAAVRQRQIKRMLAYSSVAHVGYALVGVVAWLAQPTGQGVVALAYYLFAYAVMTLGAFGVVLSLERRDDRRHDLSLDRLAGLGSQHPALALAMVVFMLSLAGIPPIAGFFAKLGVFYAAVESGRLTTVLIGILASALGAYYYLRVLVVMYMRTADTVEHRVASPWLSLGLLGCAGITLVVGILPELYLSFAKRFLAGWLG